MPASPPLQNRAAAVLGTPGSPDYETAKNIVNQAGSLSEAVQHQDFFLGGIPDQADRDEIVGMLGRIPPGVANGLLGELRNAFGRNARINFRWDEHPTGGFDHSSHTGDDGVAHLKLRTPRGQGR